MSCFTIAYKVGVNSMIIILSFLENYGKVLEDGAKALKKMYPSEQVVFCNNLSDLSKCLLDRKDENDHRLTFLGHHDISTSSYGGKGLNAEKFSEILLKQLNELKKNQTINIKTIDLIGCGTGFVKNGQSYAQDVAFNFIKNDFQGIDITASTNLTLKNPNSVESLVTYVRSGAFQVSGISDYKRYINFSKQILTLKKRSTECTKKIQKIQKEITQSQTQVEAQRKSYLGKKTLLSDEEKRLNEIEKEIQDSLKDKKSKSCMKSLRRFKSTILAILTMLKKELELLEVNMGQAEQHIQELEFEKNKLNLEVTLEIPKKLSELKKQRSKLEQTVIQEKTHDIRQTLDKHVECHFTMHVKNLQEKYIKEFEHQIANMVVPENSDDLLNLEVGDQYLITMAEQLKKLQKQIEGTLYLLPQNKNHLNIHISKKLDKFFQLDIEIKQNNRLKELKMSKLCSTIDKVSREIQSQLGGLNDEIKVEKTRLQAGFKAAFNTIKNEALNQGMPKHKATNQAKQKLKIQKEELTALLKTLDFDIVGELEEIKKEIRENHKKDNIEKYLKKIEGLYDQLQKKIAYFEEKNVSSNESKEMNWLSSFFKQLRENFWSFYENKQPKKIPVLMAKETLETKKEFMFFNKISEQPHINNISLDQKLIECRV